MAGFFVVLGDIQRDGETALKAKDIYYNICHYGMYSTNLNLSNDTADGTWAKTKEATFADYFSMKAGDYIFFFFDRKIYGVGKLVNIYDDCKYWGYVGANKPVVYDQDAIVDSRLTDTIMPENRCVCFFEPIEFFQYAVDMDEALMMYPNSFKSIRVIQERSFIRIADEEALALLAVLKRRNENIMPNDTPDMQNIVFDNSKHQMAMNHIAGSSDYDFTAESFMSNYLIWESTGVSHEMAIEAALVDSLTRNTSTAFENLDYVAHQVSASPAKPVEYMEWMDVFGYSVSSVLSNLGVPIQFAIDKYYIIEIKRDKLVLPRPRVGKATKAVANQLMKYVDWVTKNYANGAYPMVKGIIVAKDFDENFIEYCKSNCVRNYNDGYRDAIPSMWNSFELIKYSFDGQKIKFEKVYPS